MTSLTYTWLFYNYYDLVQPKHDRHHFSPITDTGKKPPLALNGFEPYLITYSILCFPLFLLFCAAILYTSCILVGIFINSSVPIFFELFIETVYPVPEGITCGVVTFLQNLFTGLLLFFLTFYCSGKTAPLITGGARHFLFLLPSLFTLFLLLLIFK